MKVLITGNKGFVGTVTQRFFENAGLEVCGYDIMDNYDIRDIAQFERIVQEVRPERILHLAAVSRFADADKNQVLSDETNTHGTKNVALIAGKYHIPTVYSSTGSVYMPIIEEPPITEEFRALGNSEYATTKRKGELYLQKFAYPWMILRYAHLYGSEKRMHGLIGGYLDRIKFGMAPVLYGGKQSNDFCYVDDVAEANYLAITAPYDKWGQIYNIGTGEELSAEAAGDIIIKIYNEFYPKNKFKGKVEKREQRGVDPSRFVYNIDIAQRMLGFKAKYSFEEGLRKMFEILSI